MAEHKGHSASYGVDVQGTEYPYWNVKQDSQTQLLADFRRSIASVNPFAHRQVPTQERAAIGLRWGNGWYAPNPYPNGIHFDRLFPTHYDPLSETNRSRSSFQLIKYAPGNYSTLALANDKLPRPCVRSIQTYRRCKMVNGAEKCKSEANDIVSICPNWALDHMKEKNRFYQKAVAINNKVYASAMKEEEYNRGRTVSDVSDKTWVHGTRTHLRPDTMWADDRYSEITQADINEAKKRVEASGAKHGFPARKDLSHLNANKSEQPVKIEAALYP